ncbi:hypothetical protein ACUYQI_000687 [Salmonella enterica subsp. enterica serovar Braenderup]
MEEFKNKANLVHKNFYSYDNVVYKNSHTKVLITCPIHGDYEQRPTNHLQGRGCRKCSNVERYTTESFIEKAKSVHGDRFEYNSTVYKSAHSFVTITCKIHGDFEQRPSSHLSGVGCAKCRDDQFRMTKEEFEQKANLIHDNKYNYDSVVYIDGITPVDIICSTHGIFKQQPHTHLTDHGCPKCSVFGFDKKSHGFFYIQKLSIDGNTIGFKYGIAKNITKRMKNQSSKSSCQHDIVFEYGADGEIIFDLERFVVDKLKKYDTISKEIVPDGYTETILGENGLSVITEAIEEFKCLNKL